MPEQQRQLRGGKWEASGYFLVSAVFHYLGPSFAVLLFAHLAPLGVAWLRIVSAAVVFAVWRRPWRIWAGAPAARRRLYLALGVLLGAMNSVFYLAIARLDLATVGAIEFLGVIAVAAIGVRTRRNLAALALAVAGVGVLSQVNLRSGASGLVLAFLNAAGFALYLVLGHKIATTAAAGPSGAPPKGAAPGGAEPGGAEPGEPGRWSGVDQLGLSMIIAALAASAAGIRPAVAGFTHPLWLLWGVGVGVCSSVVPYVADQLAMARLRRAGFALMMALLPASATVIGAVVLHQIPTVPDLCGIALVVAGIVLHKEARPPAGPAPPPLDAPPPREDATLRP